MKRYKLLLLFALMFLIGGCDGGYMEETTQQENYKTKSINDVPVSAWNKLSISNIYFGHQSVGYNIIDGVIDVMHEHPQIKLNIIATKNPNIVKNGAFAHSEVGKNTDPVSKLTDFATTMENGMGDKVDYAFMKFCYVDFNPNTDVKKVFDEYKTTYSKLKQKYPNTTFIHLTTPLTTIQKDIKTIAKNIIKRIIGRPVRTYKDNIKRNEYNKLIIEEYKGKDPIFDLAKIESTYADGRRLGLKINGEKIPVLIPDYTYDGGHLNENGRKIVAEQLLVFLANLPKVE